MVKTLLKGKASRIFDKSKYIILPERSHGSHSYDDIYVAKNRLEADNLVKKTARSLGFGVSNMGLNLNERLFIGNIDWNEALKLNLVLGGETLSIRRFIDFKELLEYGIKGGKVYHGTGKQMQDLREIRAIYEEIFAKKNPWRGEHLDAHFEKKSGELYIAYDHYLGNDELIPKISEKLEEGTMCSGKLESISYNAQGLPFLQEEIYFGNPLNGSVARFVANSGRADLNCFRYPADTVSSLGVRHARKRF